MSGVVSTEERTVLDREETDLAFEKLVADISLCEAARRERRTNPEQSIAPPEHVSSTWIASPDADHRAPNRRDDTSYIYMNGIFTDAETARRDGRAAANSYGRDVIVVHNATDGAVDIVNAAAGVVVPESSALLEHRAVSDLRRAITAELSSGRDVHLVLHSQGTLIGDQVLHMLSAEDRSRISVDAYGAANHSWPTGLRSVTEYRHDLDGVQFGTSQLDRLQSFFTYSSGTSLRIVTVPSASLDPIFGAHTFSGAAGYMDDTARFLIARGKPESPAPALTGVVDQVYALMEMYSRRIWGVDPQRLADELCTSVRRGEFSGTTYHSVIDWAIAERDGAFAAALLEQCPDGVIGEFSLSERQIGRLRELAANAKEHRPFLTRIHDAADRVANIATGFAYSVLGHFERALDTVRAGCASLLGGARNIFLSFMS